MWFIGMDGSEDDLQFLRNIRLLSTSNTRTSSPPPSPKTILSSFVKDLSFWDSSPCDYNTSKSKGKRRNCPGAVLQNVHTSSSRSKNMKDRSSHRSSTSSGGSSAGSSEMQFQHPVWKAAVDPHTGRTYYYDIITRKTQWSKPPELKAIEKKRKQEKRKRDLRFFGEMEKTLRASLARGELIPGIPLVETKKEGPPQEPVRSPRIRTISGMDDVLLAELRDDGNVIQQQSQERQFLSTGTARTNINLPGRPPLPVVPYLRRSSKSIESLELSPDETNAHKPAKSKNAFQRCDSGDLAGETLLDGPIQNTCDSSEFENRSPPNGHIRRNTGGTIYLQNTMNNPDIKATIKCVCGVYRAHIVQAAERKLSRSPVSVIMSPLDVDVFIDEFGHSRRRTHTELPTLADVLEFYEEFYRRSQMEHDTIIMSLIYVERLVKATNGALAPSAENWRSILFACMVLASKVWDDLSMWNIDFSNVSANTIGLSSFTLRRINQLELALLKSLNFDVKVPASEYAKYYFLIRTMLIRSGLVKEVGEPLGKEDAFRKLERLTSKYQDTKLARMSRDRRTKSMDDNFLKWLTGGMEEKTGPVLRDTVCLEQLVG